MKKYALPLVLLCLSLSSLDAVAYQGAISSWTKNADNVQTKGILSSDTRVSFEWETTVTGSAAATTTVNYLVLDPQGRVVYQRDDSFATPAVGTVVRKSLEVSPVTLIYSTPGIYNFRVTITEGGNAPVVSGCEFLVEHRLDTQMVKLLLPADREEVVQPNPVFNWTTVFGAMKFEIYISEFPDPRSVPLVFQTVDRNTFIYPTNVTQLVPGKTYYWQVRALGTTNLPVGANRGFSAVSQFTMKHPFGGPVTLISPLDTAVNTMTPALSWIRRDGVTKYKVTYGKEPNFTQDAKVAVGEYPDGTFYLTEPLENETRYYWQVQALDGENRIIGESILAHFDIREKAAGAITTNIYSVIKGIIRDLRTNEPIEGAEVWLTTDWVKLRGAVETPADKRSESDRAVIKQSQSFVTNASGYFEFGLSHEGTYHLVAFKNGYKENLDIVNYTVETATTEVSATAEKKEEQAKPSRLIQKDISLSRRLVAQFTVKDQAGQPVADATISLVSGQGTFTVQADATGNASFQQLTGGAYQLVAVKQDSYADYRGNVVLPAAGIMQKDITLATQGLHGLYGYITGEGDNPVTGAEVKIFTGNDRTLLAVTKSQGNGYFEVLSLPAGATAIYIESKHGMFEFWNRNFSLASDDVTQQVQRLDIRMNARTEFDISGIVTDEFDKPLANASVYLTNGQDDRYVFTNPQGRYTVRAKSEAYQLHIEKSGFRASSKAVVVLPQDSDLGPTRLEYRRATLTVQVFDQATGVSLTGVTGRYQDINGNAAVDDVQGAIILPLVSGQEYQLTIAGKVGSGLEAVYLPSTQTVQLIGNDTASVYLRKSYNTGGLVTDTQGTPLQNVEVFPVNFYDMRKMTSVDGRFDYALLQNANAAYEFAFQKDGYAAKVVSNLTPTANNTIVLKTFAEEVNPQADMNLQAEIKRLNDLIAAARTGTNTKADEINPLVAAFPESIPSLSDFLSQPVPAAASTMGDLVSQTIPEVSDFLENPSYTKMTAIRNRIATIESAMDSFQMALAAGGSVIPDSSGIVEKLNALGVFVSARNSEISPPVQMLNINVAPGSTVFSASLISTYRPQINSLVQGAQDYINFGNTRANDLRQLLADKKQHLFDLESELYSSFAAYREQFRRFRELADTLTNLVPGTNTTGDLRKTLLLSQLTAFKELVDMRNTSASEVMIVKDHVIEGRDKLLAMLRDVKSKLDAGLGLGQNAYDQTIKPVVAAINLPQPLTISFNGATGTPFEGFNSTVMLSKQNTNLTLSGNLTFAKPHAVSSFNNMQIQLPTLSVDLMALSREIQTANSQDVKKLGQVLEKILNGIENPVTLLPADIQQYVEINSQGKIVFKGDVGQFLAKIEDGTVLALPPAVENFDIPQLTYAHEDVKTALETQCLSNANLSDPNVIRCALRIVYSQNSDQEKFYDLVVGKSLDDFDAEALLKEVMAATGMTQQDLDKVTDLIKKDAQELLKKAADGIGGNDGSPPNPFLTKVKDFLSSVWDSVDKDKLPGILKSQAPVQDGAVVLINAVMVSQLGSVASGMNWTPALFQGFNPTNVRKDIIKYVPALALKTPRILVEDKQLPAFQGIQLGLKKLTLGYDLSRTKVYAQAMPTLNIDNSFPIKSLGKVESIGNMRIDDTGLQLSEIRVKLMNPDIKLGQFLQITKQSAGGCTAVNMSLTWTAGTKFSLDCLAIKLGNPLNSNININQLIVAKQTGPWQIQSLNANMTPALTVRQSGWEISLKSFAISSGYDLTFTGGTRIGAPFASTLQLNLTRVVVCQGKELCQIDVQNIALNVSGLSITAQKLELTKETQSFVLKITTASFRLNSPAFQLNIALIKIYKNSSGENVLEIDKASLVANQKFNVAGFLVVEVKKLDFNLLVVGNQVDLDLIVDGGIDFKFPSVEVKLGNFVFHNATLKSINEIVLDVKYGEAVKAHAVMKYINTDPGNQYFTGIGKLEVVKVFDLGAAVFFGKKDGLDFKRVEIQVGFPVPIQLGPYVAWAGVQGYLEAQGTVPSNTVLKIGIGGDFIFLPKPSKDTNPWARIGGAIVIGPSGLEEIRINAAVYYKPIEYIIGPGRALAQGEIAVLLKDDQEQGVEAYLQIVSFTKWGVSFNGGSFNLKVKPRQDYWYAGGGPSFTINMEKLNIYGGMAFYIGKNIPLSGANAVSPGLSYAGRTFQLPQTGTETGLLFTMRGTARLDPIEACANTGCPYVEFQADGGIAFKMLPVRAAYGAGLYIGGGFKGGLRRLLDISAAAYIDAGGGYENNAMYFMADAQMSVHFGAGIPADLACNGTALALVIPLVLLPNNLYETCKRPDFSKPGWPTRLVGDFNQDGVPNTSGDYNHVGAKVCVKLGPIPGNPQCGEPLYTAAGAAIIQEYQPPANLNGKIKLQDHMFRPIITANVCLKEVSSGTASGCQMTDAEGNASFAQLPAGKSYDIYVTKTGYERADGNQKLELLVLTYSDAFRVVNIPAKNRFTVNFNGVVKGKVFESNLVVGAISTAKLQLTSTDSTKPYDETKNLTQEDANTGGGLKFTFENLQPTQYKLRIETADADPTCYLATATVSNVTNNGITACGGSAAVNADNRETLLASAFAVTDKTLESENTIELVIPGAAALSVAAPAPAPHGIAGSTGTTTTMGAGTATDPMAGLSMNSDSTATEWYAKLKPLEYKGKILNQWFKNFKSQDVPVAGATVSVMRGTTVVSTATADATGNYHVPVILGQAFTLKVAKADYDIFTSEEITEELGSGESQTGAMREKTMDFELNPSMGKVSLTLKSKHDNTPIAGIKVCISDAAVETTDFCTQTGDDGSIVEFEALRGSKFIMLDLTEDQQLEFGYTLFKNNQAANAFNLTGSQTVNLGELLVPHGVNVSGTFVDANGQIVSTGTVEMNGVAKPVQQNGTFNIWVPKLKKPAPAVGAGN